MFTSDSEMGNPDTQLASVHSVGAICNAKNNLPRETYHSTKAPHIKSASSRNDLLLHVTKQLAGGTLVQPNSPRSRIPRPIGFQTSIQGLSSSCISPLRLAKPKSRIPRPVGSHISILGQRIPQIRPLRLTSPRSKIPQPTSSYSSHSNPKGPKFSLPHQSLEPHVGKERPRKENPPTITQPPVVMKPIVSDTLRTLSTILTKKQQAMANYRAQLPMPDKLQLAGSVPVCPPSPVGPPSMANPAAPVIPSCPSQPEEDSSRLAKARLPNSQESPCLHSRSTDSCSKLPSPYTSLPSKPQALLLTDQSSSLGQTSGMNHLLMLNKQAGSLASNHIPINDRYPVPTITGHDGRSDPLMTIVQPTASVLDQPSHDSTYAVETTPSKPCAVKWQSSQPFAYPGPLRPPMEMMRAVARPPRARMRNPLPSCSPPKTILRSIRNTVLILGAHEIRTYDE
jgi:hypothetical protein